MIENFTPWSALAGGGLVGLAFLFVFLLFGRIEGISGILGNIIGKTWQRDFGTLDWRIGFVVGLIAAPLVYWAVGGGTIPFEIKTTPWLLVLSGLLVGFGARLGNGCTSGHGICGISRLSLRSIIATLVFLGTAVVVNLIW